MGHRQESDVTCVAIKRSLDIKKFIKKKKPDEIRFIVKCKRNSIEIKANTNRPILRDHFKRSYLMGYDFVALSGFLLN